MYNKNPNACTIASFRVAQIIRERNINIGPVVKCIGVIAASPAAVSAVSLLVVSGVQSLGLAVQTPTPHNHNRSNPIIFKTSKLHRGGQGRVPEANSANQTHSLAHTMCTQQRNSAAYEERKKLI